MSKLSDFAASRPARVLVALATPAVGAVGLLVTSLPTALLYWVVGLNVTICAEILRRQLEKPFEAAVIESGPEIVSHYERLVRESDQSCLLTWVGHYPDRTASETLNRMKGWVEDKVEENKGFQMIRVYNPHSANWTQAQVDSHLRDMADLIHSGNYHFLAGSFHGTYSEGFELGYADYQDSSGRPRARGSLNFVLEKGVPYVAVVFDSGLDPRHSKPLESIRRIFIAHLNDVGYTLDADDRLIQLTPGGSGPLQTDAPVTAKP